MKCGNFAAESDCTIRVKAPVRRTKQNKFLEKRVADEDTNLNYALELIDAQSELGHGWLEHLSESVVVHEGLEHGEGVLLGHVQQQ